MLGALDAAAALAEAGVEIGAALGAAAGAAVDAVFEASLAGEEPGAAASVFGASTAGASDFGALLPSRKSVTYQPLPLS